MPTKLISFGFKYGKPERFVDIRKLFPRNPYHNKVLRPLRGDDPKVIADILKTPNFEESYATFVNLVKNIPGVVYIGCTGGHHRSVYLANRLGAELGILVEHRDYNKRS